MTYLERNQQVKHELEGIILSKKALIGSSKQPDNLFNDKTRVWHIGYLKSSILGSTPLAYKEYLDNRSTNEYCALKALIFLNALEHEKPHLIEYLPSFYLRIVTPQGEGIITEDISNNKQRTVSDNAYNTAFFNTPGKNSPLVTELSKWCGGDVDRMVLVANNKEYIADIDSPNLTKKQHNKYITIIDDIDKYTLRINYEL